MQEVKNVDFNKEELNELKSMLEQWQSEGFVYELNNTQKKIFDKLGIDIE